MKKKYVVRIIALMLVFILVFSLAACGEKPEEKPAPDPASEQSEEEPEPEPKTLAVSLGFEPASLDPALNTAVDGATMIVQLFSGLAKWDQDESGAYKIVPDLAEELVEGVNNDNGTTTYTYKLKEGLKWSDGKPVTAKDFAFAWQRASNVSTGAAYQYMYEVLDGYSESDETARINVKAVDDSTFEVTLAEDVPYWNELLAFPAFFPVREDVVSQEGWEREPATLICNGPYTMTGWEHSAKITMEKNPNYHDPDSVTMEKIDFVLTDNASNMVSGFKNGVYHLIDDVPANELNTLKMEYPEEFNVKGQIGTYSICWNVNTEVLPEGNKLEDVEAERAREEIRKAISLIFDRNYIVNEIGQAGQVPASSFVAMGITDADGKEFYQNANKEAGNSYTGYFNTSSTVTESNYNDAMTTLKKYYGFDEETAMLTNFPEINYLYNTSEGHKAIAEYFKMVLSFVGINMNLEDQELGEFLKTRRDGEFNVARNGWLADYNDPICFLGMWTTNSGNNVCQFGRGAHKDLKAYNLDLTDLGYETKVENGTWAETYDVLISTIEKEKDTVKRYGLLHKAEDLLMSTGTICPIYYYTDIYMVSQDLEGFYSNPLGYKYFMHTSIKEPEPEPEEEKEE